MAPTRYVPPKADKFIDYIGRAYEKPLGCFMLVRDFLFDHGVDIPNYTDWMRNPDNYSERAHQLQTHLLEHAEEVLPAQRQVGDLVVLSIGGIPAHIGLYAGEGLMLHSMDETGAVLERLDSLRWRNRIYGYWRIKTT